MVELRIEGTCQIFTRIGQLTSQTLQRRSANNLEHRFVHRIIQSRLLLGRLIPPRSKKSCTWSHLTCLKTSLRKSSIRESKTKRLTKMSWCRKWEKPKRKSLWKKSEFSVKRWRTREKSMPHLLKWEKPSGRRKTKEIREMKEQRLPHLSLNTDQGAFLKVKNAPSPTQDFKSKSRRPAITTWAWRCQWATPMDMIKWTSI